MWWPQGDSLRHVKARSALLLGTVAALVVGTPSPALAHGIGGRSDLPVPLEFFLVGGGVVLLLSFGLLAVLWPTPRLQDGPQYRGRGWAIPGWLAGALQVAAVGFLGLVIAAGLAGDPDVRTNIAPVSVYVVFWLILPFLASVAGNVWSSLNPWAALGRCLGLDRGPAGTGPAGVLPAAGLFVAFTWMELVYPSSAEPRALGVAAVVYTAGMLAAMARQGVDRTVASTDAFSVYHRLISAIAPLGRGPDGRIHRRGWLRALPVLPQWRGLVVFVVAMIGTVSYDGLSATPLWDDVSFALVGRAQDSVWFGTAGLLAVVAVVGVGYLGASSWAARSSGTMTGSDVARSFAHTLVPIALAYAVAHYITLIAFEGQLLFAAISDPLGLGWDLFGTADHRADFTWLSPSLVWWTQVTAIVGGHVLGVVLAHDRSLAVFEGEKAVRSQYAMLTLMVGLTMGGMSILAAG